MERQQILAELVQGLVEELGLISEIVRMQFGEFPVMEVTEHEDHTLVEVTFN